jgi:hypothetical protein
MRHPLPRLIDKQIYEYERRTGDRSVIQIKAFLASGYFTNVILLVTNGHPNLGDGLNKLPKLSPPCLWMISQDSNYLTVTCATKDAIRVRRALQEP